MRIESLRLQNFRNYPLQELSFSPDVNVICGENAQGTTNLLEAMVYLSCGKSPRARTDKELIRFGEGEARVQAKVLAREREFSLDVQLFEGKRRKISINKVTAKKASELSSVLGTVYFCPEDLFLIREGAAARRKFMETAL